MGASSPRRAELVSRAWLDMQELVEADRRSGRLRDALGLGVGLGRVRMLLLLADGPLGLAALADARGVDRPYATVVVDQLETLGYVERRPHPGDGRRKLVHLTGAGEAVASRAAAMVAEPPPPFDRLSVAEATQLAALLARVRG